MTAEDAEENIEAVINFICRLSRHCLDVTEEGSSAQ